MIKEKLLSWERIQVEEKPPCKKKLIMERFLLREKGINKESIFNSFLMKNLLILKKTHNRSKNILLKRKSGSLTCKKLEDLLLDLYCKLIFKMQKCFIYKKSLILRKTLNFKHSLYYQRKFNLKNLSTKKLTHN